MKQPSKHLFNTVKRTTFSLAFITISVCSILFYFISRQVLLTRTCLSDVSSLRQVQTMAADMKYIVGNLSYQVYNDPSVAYLLYGESFEPSKVMLATTQLNNYRNTNPYVESIYVYNYYWDSVTVSSSKFGTFDAPLSGEEAFFDTQIVDLLHQDIATPSQYQPIPRVVKRGKDKYLYYTYLTSNTFSHTKIQSAVFVNFSGTWMESVIKDTEDSPAQTLIINENGTVICNNEQWPIFSRLTENDFYLEMQQQPNEDGYFLCDIQGEKYVVSYFKPGSENWQYLRLTPYQYVIGEIDRAIRILLLIIAVLVLCGAIASYLSSLHIYAPIEEMQKGMEQLEQENRETRQASRQHLLQNLLYGYTDASALSADGSTDLLQFRNPQPKTFLLVLIRIYNYRALHQEYDAEGRSLMRYAVLNVASEICSRYFSIETIDMGGSNHLAMILSIPQKKYKEMTTETFEELLTEVNTSVQHALGLSLSFTVSDSFPVFSEISKHYRMTREASFHHIFYPAGTILYGETVLENSRKHYNYPQLQEDRMVEAIMSSNEEKACEWMRSILLETKEYSYSVINLAVSHLTLAISNILDEIRKNKFIELPEDLISKMSILGNFRELESINEVIEDFESLIHQIVVSLEDKRNSRHTDLLQRVSQLIEENYSDPSCCLDSIAEAVNLSSAYVGKLYKRYTLKSVSESINELRMNEAKRLLQNCRRMTVADIAERTGFSSSSYFSKAFRKENGMTPNEYRNLHPSDKD